MSVCRMHLKKLVCQASNHGLRSFERCLGVFRQKLCLSPQPWEAVVCANTGAMVTATRLHCTKEIVPKGQPAIIKKVKPHAIKVLGNVGRSIPHNVIQVISENGENMGTMSRWKVIQTMEKLDLKLVLLNEKADPPVYRLMTGKQLFEEQMKLREKRKLAAHKVVQVSQMSIIANIQKHDLDVKKKQLSQWIEKKHHVKITVINKLSSHGSAKEDVLQDILNSLEGQNVHVSEPKDKQDGQAIACMVRPLSAKEIQKLKTGAQQKNEKEPSTPMTNEINP